jgi:hypothetical protein
MLHEWLYYSVDGRSGYINHKGDTSTVFKLSVEWNLLFFIKQMNVEEVKIFYIYKVNKNYFNFLV